VRISSVCDEGIGGYPFEAAVDQALRKGLQIAGELGLRTQYSDGGYYGYSQVGDRAVTLGILGYLDMVPPGKLKDYERLPFDPVEREGLLYSRGTQDDKCPLLAYLFGVKALLGTGVKFNNRVRFIFGADEETLWRCINRYKEREEAPTLGFSPDTRFPLIYAE
jgi:acetylornithine deacetylase/succinyl-diaminopimelate desuccinylase-like protein